MENLAPWDGAGVLWLADNTPQSRANALKTVYVSPEPKPKRKRKGK